MIALLDYSLQINPRGLVGTRKFGCLNSELVGPGLPIEGDAWDAVYPYLRADAIQIEPDTVAPYQSFVTVAYSTQGEFGADFFSRSFETGCDVLDLPYGCHWEDTGTPVNVPVSLPLPYATYCVSLRLGTCNFYTMADTVGKINSISFHGFPAETLQCLTPSISESYDRNGVLTSVQSTFRFLYRPQGHLAVWRAPVQKVVDGMPQYYQNDDPSKPNYTTNASLDSTPVYVSGATGTGAWTKIHDPSNQYLLESCNFATTLNIPTIA